MLSVNLMSSALMRRIVGTVGLLIAMACVSPEPAQLEKAPGVNPWNHLRFQNDPDNFQFAMISDLTGRERVGVIQDAVGKLNLLQPEFVVSIGDLIEGHTNDADQLNRDWDQFFKAVAPLEAPLFYVPGNHDYWYATTQTSDGSREVYDMAAVYKQRVGRSYYHFVYKNVLFLILNNSMGDPAEIEEQERYIVKTLNDHRNVRWTFTFFHYAESFAGGGDPIWRLVSDLLKDRPYTSFGGNSHQYIHFERAGRDHINLATTGGMSRMRGPEYGEFDHLVWVTMTNSGPKIVNLMLDGVYDKYIRTEKSRLLTNRLLRASPIRSDTIVVTGDKFWEATASLRLVNDADIPLRVSGSFEGNDDVTAEPSRMDVEVPPKSRRTVDVRLIARSSSALSRASALVLDWKATHTLPGNDPDVEVKGRHRIPVQVLGSDYTPNKPVIVERFRKWPLGPEWQALGPGPSRDAAGRFVLADDPKAADVPGQSYKYTDGRGVYTLTPTWHLPIAGLYRDIPANSFVSNIKLSQVRWAGDSPAFRWEFWDAPDLTYNYGPIFLRGVIVELYCEGSKHFIVLRTIRKLDAEERRMAANEPAAAGQRIDGQGYLYTDLTKLELKGAPVSLALRAAWREPTRSWKFSYGVDGAEPEAPIPGGEFVEDVRPSPEGKRNLLYVGKARREGGFSVVLDEYTLLH